MEKYKRSDKWIKKHFKVTNVGNLMFFASLIWLGFPMYYAVVGAYPRIMIFFTLLVGVCYIGSLYVKNNIILKVMWIYMIVYIVFATWKFAIANVMMFMYLSSLINYRFEDTNLRSFYNVSLMMTVLIELSELILKENIDTFEQYVGFLLVSVCFFMHISMRLIIVEKKEKEAKKEHSMYINYLLAENERNRIGRDLHDTLGHVFALMKLKSELSLKFMDMKKYTEATKEIEELNSIAKNAMTNVRKTVENINYKKLSEEIDTVRYMLKLAEIRLEMDVDVDMEALNPTLQSTVGMIVRELVNNILKHSFASACKLAFYCDDKGIFLKMQDNGVGFKSLDGKELQNIRSRLDLIKGNVTIESEKSPTIVKVFIPYENEVVQ